MAVAVVVVESTTARLRLPHVPVLLVAACLWMLSASWCYDGYLLFRDGMYPITWWSNIAASSILYIIVGLIWNLDVRPARGATFAFLEPQWLLPTAPGAMRGILLWMLPFALLGTAALALSQVNRVIAAVRGREAVPDPAPPPALNATLEFDINAGSIVARQWTKHPLCSCGRPTVARSTTRGVNRHG